MKTLPGQIAATEMVIDRFPNIQSFQGILQTLNSDLKTRWVRAFGALDIIKPEEYTDKSDEKQITSPQTPPPPEPDFF
jgi:hypothetical protein